MGTHDTVPIAPAPRLTFEEKLMVARADLRYGFIEADAVSLDDPNKSW